MISRLSGAVLRAAMVILMIAMPALVLAHTSVDTAQIVALVCIVAGVFTFVEYNSSSPSLIEFRDAPPFNRIRFGGLAATVVALTVIAKGATDPTTLTALFQIIGGSLADAMDFPYSPVRLVVLMLPPEADVTLINDVRIAAGLSYLVSLLSLAVFVVALRLKNWPNQRGGFNVWTNLPTFDPTAGGDVVHRLERDGQVNLILGFLLPFLIPALVKLASDVFNPIQLQDTHTLIWTMTAWAFIPSSLIMRGIAMLRVAQMISNQRERAYLNAKEDDGLPA
ncbi:hypothetical protein [Pseudooctadecabacter jejudonensis]|uniref:Uncharacterized protein n=1 Tax=Pseudooctadecabacter jejudonensis TaxID=1391910 RepID=A0A1Y5S3F6_9RHOB|nr:hypothetical protein [Pseudooctadecabacter jejudonensis]SLN30750.1 hypothetical protein PSJ8397_01400 [Pseudooctadecabacter jejudonensis]